MNQITPDANKSEVREAVRGIIDWINEQNMDKKQPGEDTGPMVHNPDSLESHQMATPLPATYSNTAPPIEPAKWHLHPTSDKMLLKPDNTTRMRLEMTDKEWEEAKRDLPELAGEVSESNQPSEGV